MSKIGILTFSNTLNNGAALQCFALSQYLMDSGHQVSVFDYRNKYIESSGKRRLKSVRSLKDIVLWILTKREFNQREKLFEDFNTKYLNFVQCAGMEHLKRLSKEYDYIIVGSDQVWNYNLTKSDSIFFFPFDSQHAKKIAYSASFGSCGIECEQWIDVKEYLSDFHDISVREDYAAKLLKEKTGIEPRITIDPTLIIDKSNWSTMAQVFHGTSRYILAYVISKREKVTEEALRIGERLKLPVVILQTGTVHSTKGAKDIKGAGPQDFIDLFYNSDYVVTDSFHGVCFSLIFEKNFQCILGNSDGANSRILDLLRSVGLQDRAESVNTYDIDYESVNIRLERLANQSREYLLNALESI